MQICDEPARCANYWRNHIQTEPMFNPDVECCIVLCLNARRRVTGHHFVSLGLIDQVLLHPREVLRAAIISSASAIVIMHNHPSGETNPSEADIVATRRIMRAGEVVSVPLLDHVIVNNTGQYTSMRASGFLVKL
ncbi:MAG: JAB domain-containing protein [Limisphaerales bacterium]